MSWLGVALKHWRNGRLSKVPIEVDTAQCNVVRSLVGAVRTWNVLLIWARVAPVTAS